MAEVSVIIFAICGLTALAAWLIRAARELSQGRNDLSIADKQLAMYSLLHAKSRDGPEAQRTLEQVELSRTIYQNMVTEYNRCLNKPGNRTVARLLHYRPVSSVKEDV